MKGELRWKRKKKQERSNIGTRPHRCDVRYTDFLASVTATWSPSAILDRWRLFYRCMRSEIGQEPQEPIEYLDDDSYEFYREMQFKRKIREKFIDKSNPFEPFDHEVYLPPRRKDLENREL